MACPLATLSPATTVDASVALSSVVVSVTELAASRGLGIEVQQLVAGYGTATVLHEVDLAVEPGEIVALLGPSGCGKTTLLRCIAGLETPRSGSIRIGERSMTAGRGVAPERRRVGMVFQDGALFPHRTVLTNVNYGVPRGANRNERAREVLRLVGLDERRDCMPGTLSGGEQQRVALARALAPAPGVILLDEPFSSLDAALRVQLRDEVRRLLKDISVTTVLVTHDQQEALTFGDRVAVMRAGVIEQVGLPETVYSAPASPWVAQFVGEAALLSAEVDGTVAHTVLGSMPTLARFTGAGVVMVRPEQLRLAPGGAGTVRGVQYFGADTRYDVSLAGLGTLVVRSPGSPAYSVGEAVTPHVTGTAVHAWPGPAALPATRSSSTSRSGNPAYNRP